MLFSRSLINCPSVGRSGHSGSLGGDRLGDQATFAWPGPWRRRTGQMDQLGPDLLKGFHECTWWIIPLSK